MIFSTGEKEYRGSSAVEIVQALKREDGQAEGAGLREYLMRSLGQLSDRIPLRDLDVSDRLSEEMLALSYLYLRDEFGAGELRDVPGRRRWAHPL